MPRARPILFSVKYCEKPFRGRHWYVSGFVGEKRIQLWFPSEREAKAAAAHRNAEIKAHGTQIALSPVDRIRAIAAAEKHRMNRKDRLRESRRGATFPNGSPLTLYSKGCGSAKERPKAVPARTRLPRRSCAQKLLICSLPADLANFH